MGETDMRSLMYCRDVPLGRGRATIRPGSPGAPSR